MSGSYAPESLAVCKRIGLHIRAARRNMGYTQEKLADRLDLSANFIAHLERGSRKPSLDTLIALSAILDVPLEDLLKADTTVAKAPVWNPLVRRACRLLKDAPSQQVKLVIQMLEEMRFRSGTGRSRWGRQRR